MVFMQIGQIDKHSTFCLLINTAGIISPPSQNGLDVNSPHWWISSSTIRFCKSSRYCKSLLPTLIKPTAPAPFIVFALVGFYYFFSYEEVVLTTGSLVGCSTFFADIITSDQCSREWSAWTPGKPHRNPTSTMWSELLWPTASWSPKNCPIPWTNETAQNSCKYLNNIRVRVRTTDPPLLGSSACR